MGYEDGAVTREEACKAVMIECKTNKKIYGVLSPAYVYDVNGDMVYEQDIARAHSSQ